MLPALTAIASLTLAMLSGERESLRDILYREIQARWPEPILEELVGNTESLVQTIGTEKALEIVDRLTLEGHQERARDWLSALAGDADWGVREVVAKNPSTPASTLQQLAEDEDWQVRKAIAKNP